VTEQGFQFCSVDRRINSIFTHLSILNCRFYTGHVGCELQKVQVLVIKFWEANFLLLGQETFTKHWVHICKSQTVRLSKALAQWIALNIARSIQI
jgi:hypothetical protein